MNEEGLSLDGWRQRRVFLAEHPEFHVFWPSLASFDWMLRIRRRALAPYLRRRGREILIHEAAAAVLPDLVLRPVTLSDSS